MSWPKILPALLAGVVAGTLIWWALAHPSPNQQRSVSLPPLFSALTVSATSTGLVEPARLETASTEQRPAAGKTFSSTPGQETRYLDDAHHFSLDLPAGFTAAEAPTNVASVEAVTVSNGQGDRLLVIAAPAGGNVSSFTIADAKRILPDLAVEDSASVEIVPGTSGVAFTAKNDPQWQGAESANLWFTYNSLLYRISTPVADANLLTFIWDSWRF